MRARCTAETCATDRPASSLPGGRGSRRNAAGPAARRPEARGPRLQLRARAPRSPGLGPPLGRFRFRFPAETVEENESAYGQGRRSCRRGEGRSVRGRRPEASELGP